MTNRLIVKSKKQHIRLWFEFLKICLDSPKHRSNLEKLGSFYAPWGDVRDQKFDEWWIQHQHLFSITQVEEIKRVQKRKEILNIAIPLNQSLSVSVKQISQLIRDKQSEALISHGVDPTSRKTKKFVFGQYETTPGVEIRGRSIHEDLVMYQIWISLESPSLNMETVRLIRNALLSRPRAKWIPTIIADENPIDPSNTVRQLRRRLNRAQRVCDSVSNGEFPGKNSV